MTIPDAVYSCARESSPERPRGRRHQVWRWRGAANQVNKLRLLCTVVGGVPAVLLVAHFVPQPSHDVGAPLWLVALWIIGWAATTLLYRLLSAIRRR